MLKIVYIVSKYYNSIYFLKLLSLDIYYGSIIRVIHKHESKGVIAVIVKKV